MKIIFNGQLLHKEDPQVLIEDNELSVFETFKVVGGRCPGTLQQHYERLFQSVQIMGLGLEYPLTQKQLDDSLNRLLSSLDLGLNYRIKICVSQHRWWIMASDLVLLSPEIYSKGVMVDEAVVEREFAAAKWSSPLYQQFWDQQKISGAFETLFFSAAGNLLEGNISNVVAVLDGILVSPKKDVLPGITVRELFQKAQQKGLSTEFRNVTRHELQGASEIFITNSIKGVVPVKAWKQWRSQGFAIYKKHIIDIN